LLDRPVFEAGRMFDARTTSVALALAGAGAITYAMAMRSLSTPGSARKKQHKSKRSWKPLAGPPSGPAMSVTMGPLAGHYDAVLLETDLEPDDVAAIKALAPRLTGVKLLVVVGEGDVDKRALMRAILSHYGLLGNARVLQGRRSSVPYPAEALAAFPPAAVETVTTSTNTDGDVTSELSSFLAAASAPLAIILKPPHELLTLEPSQLARTSAASYGSFNFHKLRDVMMSDGVAADKEAAAKRQLSLFGAFKKFVWIERSDAVGRDKTLSSNQETVWPLLRTDAPLVALMAAWSMKAVNEATKKIARFEKEVQSAWKLDGAEAQFKQVAEDASWAAKRVAMVESIAQTGGMQMPYADPLVVAVLLDDEARLTDCLRPVAPTIDAGTDKISFAPAPSSSLFVLQPEDKSGKDDLFHASLEVLKAAYA